MALTRGLRVAELLTRGTAEVPKTIRNTMPQMLLEGSVMTPCVGVLDSSQKCKALLSCKATLELSNCKITYSKEKN